MVAHPSVSSMPLTNKPLPLLHNNHKVILPQFKDSSAKSLCSEKNSINFFNFEQKKQSLSHVKTYLSSNSQSLKNKTHSLKEVTQKSPKTCKSSKKAFISERLKSDEQKNQVQGTFFVKILN